MKKLFTNLIGACCSLVIISLLTTTNLNAQYCAASATNTTDDWLSNVTFAGIDNSSGSTTYSDYTDISGIVVPGSTYEFSGTVGQTSTWTQTITVYIDWDQSMSWEPSERYTIGTTCNSNGCVLTEDIEVPATATPGETRMRVIHAESTNNSNPCAGPYYGEVEDYTINVQSGVCTPPNFTYTIVNDCEAENYDVTATLTDFGSSSFITVYFDRSDEVAVSPATLPFPLQGQTVNLINDVPFGVTVTATISGSNPICDLTRNWAQEYCHIDGEICDAPLVVSELPFTDSGNTDLYLDDYDNNDVPANSPDVIGTGSNSAYYMTGDDVVYAYTPDEDGAIDIEVTGTGSWAGLYVFTGCPFDLTVGYHNTSTAGTRTVDHLPVTAGVTYYIVISTNASPQSTPYTLNITPWEDCEGTPTAGIASEGEMVCGATAFELVATDASPDANGLIYTWQSSPTGANTWTDVEGANAPTSTNAAGINEDTDFRLKAYCTASDETDYSNVVTFTVNPNYTECYCIPTYSTGCTVGDDLSNVTLAGESVTIDNDTDCSADGYADFTALPAPDLAPGETYSLSASTSYGSPQYEDVKAWIDYNLNGAFEESELIANTNGDGLPGGTGTFGFTIPENLDAGDYRLRVRVVYSNSTFDACSNQTYGETHDYMVEIIDLDACSGTPEAGTAANDAFSICATLPFDLSVAGASDPADGLSRVWQSSPAGANTWTDIDGATSANYTVAGIEEATDFRYSVVCANGGGSAVSNVVEVSLNPAVECYCEASNSSSTAYYIASVSTNGALQDIDKTSGFTAGGYADYTATDTLIVYSDLSFDYNVTYPSSTYGLGIWVDLNQNGTFDEPEEKIVAQGYATSHSGTITIPADLADGSYRMRVRAFYIGTVNPCGDLNYSEAEDYVLKVITLNECAGTPEGGDAGDNFSVCASNAINLSVSGASSPANGLTRNWQSSPAGANTFTDILDATSVNFTLAAGVDEPTDFRYRVTCENSGETAYSNVVAVTLNPGVECYCTPTYNYDCTSGDLISNVSLTGESLALNNTTTCSPDGYGDYTDPIAADLAPGETYSISISTTYSSPGSEQVKAYIDYNENGFFDESEEIVNTNTAGLAAGGTSSFEFTVPEGLDPGNYRLRVRMVYGSNMDFDACGYESFGETEDYMVEIIELGVCSGTPDAGTADMDEFLLCPNTPISLMVTGASDPADGLERTWQLSDDGGATWADIAGATSTIYEHPGVSVDTDFRYSVTCTYSSETAYSNVVSVVVNTDVTECYCTPTGTNGSYYINNFSTTGGASDISNLASGFSAGGYGDFTSMVVSQVQTQSVSFSEDFVGGSAGFRIWVDWNQDGQFDTETEVAWNSTGYSNSHSGSFTVPQSALAGETRMRVVAHYLNSQGLIDPCGSFSYGEFEDYTFDVIALEECAGTPSAGTADNDEIFVCPTAPITLSVTGSSDPATGLTKNWQSSPAGAGTWTDIPGAIAPTYVLANGVSEATDFRYVATCANSQETDISNVVEVTINTNVTECYCTPEATNSARYINNFSTTDGTQNVSNLASGFSTGGYGDFTTMTVEQATEETVSFNVDIMGGTAGFRIWVDWNQDGAFDTTTEVAYNSSSYSSAHSGSFTVPAGAAAGETRMRVVSHWLSSAGAVDPCVTGFTYGEFEDYTFVVSSGSSSSLNGSVVWNSSCGDRDGTVKLYEPNTATLVASYDITVGATGAFSVSNLPAGTYDVIVKVDGYLAKGVEDVEIVAGSNILEMGVIGNGDVNNNNVVNLLDFSLINIAFGKSVGDASYNELADLNCNGVVNLLDISIFNISFAKAGAVAPL